MTNEEWLAGRLERDRREYPQSPKSHDWVRNELGLVDYFQLEAGFHNGPRCERCGEEFCEHCTPGRLIEDCPLA